MAEECTLLSEYQCSPAHCNTVCSRLYIQLSISKQVKTSVWTFLKLLYFWQRHTACLEVPQPDKTSWSRFLKTCYLLCQPYAIFSAKCYATTTENEINVMYKCQCLFLELCKLDFDQVCQTHFRLRARLCTSMESNLEHIEHRITLLYFNYQYWGNPKNEDYLDFILYT